MSAERVRDRGDDADFADAVVEAVAARSFRAGVRNLHQRPVLGHACQDFVKGDYGIWRPRAPFFERHEFDEPHGYTFLAGEHAEGDDLVFVEAAHQHAIHFQRPESGAPACADAGQNVVISVGHAGDACEAVRIDRVHGDGNAGQAGILQRLGEIREQMSIAGKCDVERGGIKAWSHTLL